MKNLTQIIIIFLLVTTCSDNDSIEAPVLKPIAFNDLYYTEQNKDIVISDILKNDKNTEGTSLEINTSSTKGSVVNNNGVITFTPENNFIGKDSFTYTICEMVQNNCSTATVFIEIEKAEPSVAVNDSYITIANKTLEIDDLIANDIALNNAIVESVSATANTQGNVSLNNDVVTYIPKIDFVGEDTFIYTLCDDNDNCSNAQVTITVEEGITAVNDNYNTSNTKAITISNLMDNDIIVVGTIIDELDISSTQGTAELQVDGTVIFTPKVDFIGQDSFTYTICDDDTANRVCSTATVTINVFDSIGFNVPSALQSYYQDVLFVNDATIMFDEIESVTTTSHTTILSYTQRHDFLYDADEDLNNANNVILMYSGESRYWEEYSSPTNTYSPQTFNTEHIYPQSLFEGGETVRADLHHLRVADESINSARLNYPFTDGSGTYGLVGGNMWYPGDEWKGDVARMIMYLNIRYGESFSDVGTLELFLQWNIEDPVSAFEEQRNTIIYGAQGNRNPFIDNPYLATLIWGGNDAENKW